MHHLEYYLQMDRSESKRERRPQSRRRPQRSKPTHNNGHQRIASMAQGSILMAAVACCLALTSALSPSSLRKIIHHRTFQDTCTRSRLSTIQQPERKRVGLHSTQMTTDSSQSDIQSSMKSSEIPRVRISSKLPPGGSSSKLNSKRRKYSRKLPLTPTEKAASNARRKRQSQYEKMRLKSLNITNEPPSIWSFESLFPSPVLDEKSITEDLYGDRLREEELSERRRERGDTWKDEGEIVADVDFKFSEIQTVAETVSSASNATESEQYQEKVDKTLTRMVQDRMSGLTRNPDGSVQFKERGRRDAPLPINIDRLNYFAKKDMSHGKLEEAQQYYLRAIGIDPTDGRAYLGLSRIAQRRGDLEYARSLLKQGIHKSARGFIEVRGPAEEEKDRNNNRSRDNKRKVVKDGPVIGTIRDNGPNPFLLQALGALEQKTGNIGAAEDLYLQALRSRPSHAAAWVALAQLRTKELRQGARAGRVCYQSAEHELKRIGAKPNAFVYTAWARNEYVRGDEGSIRRARELYQLALDADPYCSTAYLQLGAMESENGNYERAEECFEEVLKFDRRNSRVLQAYAIMESRRPRDEVDSRKVLHLFEKALKANSRDAGVYQAYALYVKEWGDIDSARDLLRKGTEVNKRHAPAWQAWGVLETDYSTAKIARDVFQQGIWACAQPGGGQSGGRRCARLWQAWGCLEAQEGEHAAARRCFSRALDADPRNVAAVTAWTSMEADIGNFADARSIFQSKYPSVYVLLGCIRNHISHVVLLAKGTLKLFPTPSDEKMAIWRAWEVMEERTGNSRAAQIVFQRSMSDSMSANEDYSLPVPETPSLNLNVITTPVVEDPLKRKRKEKLELSRLAKEGGWDSDVWINNGSIEGRVPAKTMKKLRKRK